MCCNQRRNEVFLPKKENVLDPGQVQTKARITGCKKIIFLADVVLRLSWDNEWGWGKREDGEDKDNTGYLP